MARLPAQSGPMKHFWTSIKAPQRKTFLVIRPLFRHCGSINRAQASPALTIYLIPIVTAWLISIPKRIPAVELYGIIQEPLPGMLMECFMLNRPQGIWHQPRRVTGDLLSILVGKQSGFTRFLQLPALHQLDLERWPQILAGVRILASVWPRSLMARFWWREPA